MEKFKQQLFQYLDKMYYVEDNLFFEKLTKNHIWGGQIGLELVLFFNFDSEFCKIVFKQWAENNGFSTEDVDWELAYRKQVLKTTWNPELHQDLQFCDAIIAEQELVSMLIEQISLEFKSEVLNSILITAKTGKEFLGLMKCIGYDTTQTIYNPETFAPYKNFVAASNDRILEERRKNPLWRKSISRK